MAEKTQGMWARLIGDWRVWVLVIALLVSVIFLAPGYSNGQLKTNLKFGLDFEGGSYVKLKLINNSSNNSSFSQPISASTLDLTKSIIEQKINAYGLQNTPVNTVTDDQGNAYVLINFAGIPYDQAMRMVGHQGKFEISIQTTGNNTVVILDGSDVQGVGDPYSQMENDGSAAWGVKFLLTPGGAQKFQQACIKYGATTDPNNHYITMLLDGKGFYSRPLAKDLADMLATNPQDEMIAMTGTGQEGKDLAKDVSVQMRAGALPVSVTPVSSGQVPAEQGAMFKSVVIIAMILAQCAIGAIMYFRYREPRIILPMFLTSIFEVVILLGVAAFINWEIDLPSVAGIIAVIGTGIDQLIIITDEVMTTGKAPTTKKILQKLSSAFKIIVSSAATVVVAMVPLWYMGFGALKGFAITTILGVFIGILITRPAYGRIISDILNK
jgi:preprotein translocase subunit SecD